MKLLSQTTSLRVEVVAILGQEAQEEESQVSQGIDEALMINLETVFLNQVEVAQDQVVDLEDQILADMEDLSEADLENQILADLENQVTAASQILADLEDLSEADLEDQILADLEDQILAEPEDQVTAASQILAEPEDQVTAASQILAEPEDLSEADLEDQAAAAKDLAVMQQINRIIKNRIKALI